MGVVLPLGAVTNAAYAPALPTCDGLAATIVATASTTYPPTPVIGTPGDDVIVGSEGGDAIDGGGGNDTICGLAGEDVILGGDGDDRLFGGLDGKREAGQDYFGDRIEPGPGDDYIDLGHDPRGEDLGTADRGYWDQVSYRNATGPVTVDLAAGTATGEGTDTIAPIVHAAGIEGSGFDDHLFGSDLEDWIAAGGGDDVINGRDGDDVIDTDRSSRIYDNVRPRPGDDRANGGRGDDEINGGYGRDVLHGDAGRDSISVTKGAGTLAFGDGGRDVLGGITGNVGRATLLGGPGNDELRPRLEFVTDIATAKGGPGRDQLTITMSARVAPDRSRVVVGSPTGTVRTVAGTVLRFSGVEIHSYDASRAHTVLTWYGTRHADTLRTYSVKKPVHAFGRGGNDRLRGGSSADVLDGGAGRDVLDGASGRDRCLRGERLISCEIRR